MCSQLSKKLNAVVNLTLSEQNLIFGEPKPKAARFQLTPPVPPPIREHQLPTTPVQDVALLASITKAIEQAKLLLIKFPPYEKPPEFVFQNTMSAFMNRRIADQNKDIYYKWTEDDLNIAKLKVEYTIVIKYLTNLLDGFKHFGNFKKFQTNVNEMLELEAYLLNLEEQHLQNIQLLRQQEIHLVKMCRRKTSSDVEAVLDDKYYEIENEIHDQHIIGARQRRFNKNIFNAQLDQIKKRETKNFDELLNENIDLKRHCEIESIVHGESARCNLLMIEEYNYQIHLLSEKYEIDLNNTDLAISQVESDINYLEEMWEQKMIEKEIMKKECDEYVESVRERKAEVTAKRLLQPWIVKSRKNIADRKRKAKRLAKKNKNKKK